MEHEREWRARRCEVAADALLFFLKQAEREEEGERERERVRFEKKEGIRVVSRFDLMVRR